MAQTIEKEYIALYEKAAQLRRHLLDCVNALPNPELRDVLDRVYVKGQNIESVATEMDRSVKTAKRLLHRAVEMLASSTDFFSA